MWTGGLPHLIELPHLPGVPHPHVNRPLRASMADPDPVNRRLVGGLEIDYIFLLVYYLSVRMSQGNFSRLESFRCWIFRLIRNC